MKRRLITAFVFVALLIAGTLGYLDHHFGDLSRAVDTWLTEAGHKLQDEPIDPVWVVTQVAKYSAPIAMFLAGVLALLLIAVVAYGLRKQAKRLPRARFSSRKKHIAKSGPRRAEG